MRTLPEWHFRNREKARWLRRSWVLLTVGMVFIAIAAVFVLARILKVTAPAADGPASHLTWGWLGAMIGGAGLLTWAAIRFDWLGAGRDDQPTYEVPEEIATIAKRLGDSPVREERPAKQGLQLSLEYLYRRPRGWIWRARPAILGTVSPENPARTAQDGSQELDKQKHALETWRDHERRQEFEHQLIDRKTTWLLTAQTILFAAYGVTFRVGSTAEEVREFRTVVSFVGIAIAAAVLIGVMALVNSKRFAWKDYQKYFEDPRAAFDEARVPLPKPLKAPLQWGVRTPNTVIALAPDLFLPIAIILAWASLMP
jgi:hypothetical protein